MGRFIVFTFLVLGLVYYELSGGSDFRPMSEIVASAEADVRAVPEEEVVQLASLSNADQLQAPDAEAVLTQAVQTIEASGPGEAVLQNASLSMDAPAALEGELTKIEEVAAAPADLRYVAGSRVNVREGPSTNFGIVTTLSRGAETEVIGDNGQGWLEIRIVGQSQTGWMAERLLTAGG